MPDMKFRSSRSGESDFLGCCDDCGKRSGFGFENWRNQEQKFVGTFVTDAFHGEGAYAWFTGNERLAFEGHFYSNFKEGYGLVSLPDGSVFEGLFCNNRPFGPGIKTHANGRQDVGFWCGNRMVRLSRSVDFIVPRLASTSAGKLKLLRFQTIVPFLEEDADVAAAMRTKHALDSSQSHRLYSNLIHDPRSVFFNRPHMDNVCFAKANESDSSSVSSPINTLLENPKTGISSLEDTLVPDSRSSSRRQPFSSNIDDPPLPEEKYENKSPVGVLRFHAIHRTLDGYPIAFPGEEDANILMEFKRQLKVVTHGGESHACGVTQLLSWNRSELCTEMLKQIFRFRSFEENLTFKISELMAGRRTEFRKTGEMERLCLHFLKMCSIGPVYVIKDMLCSKNISEALTDARGNNSIMFAAATDQHDVMDLLIDNGTDVNSFNDENLTPLNFCLLRRIAEAASLGNWEVSFLAPDPSVPDVAGAETKTWQTVESIESLDRIFGDGMSARDSEAPSSPDTSDFVERNSVFRYDSEDSRDTSGATLLLYKQKEVEKDEPVSRSATHADGTAQVGRGVCPVSFKREEYLKSVAEPTEHEKYFFDLNREKSEMEQENSLEPGEPGCTIANVQSKALDKSEENTFITLNEKICNIDRTIELLLRRGADPNLGDAPKPSLHLAVHSKEVKLVRLLLGYGAAPDSHTLPQEGSLTPLHVLVLMKPGKEQVAMCQVLLNHGASPEEETAADFSPNGENDPLSDPEHGRTPLQLLCTRREAEYADPERFLVRLALLLARVSKRGRFFRGHSYLTLAMISGNHALAEALLTSKRVDPNEVLGRDLGTALHVLVSAELQKRTTFEDSIRMCDLLLEHGANPNLKFRRPPSLAGTCVDYGYREVERQKNNAEQAGDVADVKCDAKHYPEEHLRVVEYLEKRAKRGDEGERNQEANERFGTESGHKRSPGSRSRKQDYGDRVTKERKIRRSEEEEEEEEGKVVIVRRNERGETEQGTRANARDETPNNQSTITEIKKSVQKEEARKRRGGKDTGKGKGKKESKVGRGGRNGESRHRIATENASEEKGKTKRSEAGGSGRFPERFRQSLIRVFRTCGESLDLNHFLFPYVVLRNGDLYYRFKGQRPPRTEQYSLI